MTINMMQEKARKSAEQAIRVQILRAMERLVTSIGGKNVYIKWLEAMPEDVQLSVNGGIEQNALMEIAGDDYLYERALKAFAANMGPVLMEMAEE